MNQNYSHSDYLFARPSFLAGIARLFDFWGLFDSYNYSRTPEVADAKAIRADWLTVGNDLRWAINRFKPSDPHH
jgi:hypothetical protein